jgi:hypothetical protein
LQDREGIINGNTEAENLLGFTDLDREIFGKNLSDERILKGLN